MLKPSYVQQSRQRDGSMVSGNCTSNRSMRNSKWRSGRNQIMIQSLISETSKPRSVVRYIWSLQRTRRRCDVIVGRCLEVDDWIRSFFQSFRR